MLNQVERVLFILLVVISLAAAYGTFNEMIRVIERGHRKINWSNLPRRMVRGTLALASQGRILRHRRITSLFHFAVAWGFIYYGFVNLIDILEGMVPNFQFLPGTIVGDIYRLLADLLTVGVLVGIIYLMVRRFGARPLALRYRENVKLHPKVPTGISRDSAIVGTFILFHVGFRFLSTTFLIAQHGRDPWQPFANLVAPLWSGLPAEAITAGWHISWWVALGLIFLFLPYFPYTKHAHLFLGPINEMVRPERRALGALEPINFEDESIEQFGANKLTDLSDKHILDAFACIMCNRCQDACPAYITGKELSPAALEVNKRYYIKEYMSQLADGGPDPQTLLDYAISESAVWACTACGACVEVCPVGNEPMFDILYMRRDMVLMESNFPEDLKSAFIGMERLGNPWGMTENRMAWAQPLDFKVPTVEENPDFEYLFWVGCAGAFDPSAQEVARAVATILHSADISFAVLGENESCTGDSARRAGNEYLFFEMATANIETLNAAGVDKKRIVTSCPHCLTTLGKEYPDLGGHYQVYHHTQMISDLVGKGKLKLNGNMLEKTTFHDPCYLGRHNNVFDSPRDALAQAGVTLLEMGRTKDNSFCCGAGGAQMWKEEEHGREAVNNNRFEEAQATGAETLAVGCPFCTIMLKDANQKAGSTMKVRDVAEIVVEAMG